MAYSGCGASTEGNSSGEVLVMRCLLCWLRFMGIAEQMGRVLQRTSISVNIKERLDFSCALFGPDGSLVANAPHLPVHLGAMSEAIRYQVHRMHPVLLLSRQASLVSQKLLEQVMMRLPPGDTSWHHT